MQGNDRKVPLDYARSGASNPVDQPARRRRTAVVVAWIGMKVAYWIVLLGLVVLAILKFKKMVGVYEGFMRR